MRRRAFIALALLSIGIVAPAASGAEPTQDAPIVVGDRTISRGALEDLTRRYQGTLIDRGMSRETAAGALIHREMLRGEARRRRLSVREPEADWLDPTVQGLRGALAHRRAVLAVLERRRRLPR